MLSSDDPVRVFQEFATLDLLSGGRAEIMAGRGSFIESFPLFGYDLDDYDELFAEKLELLLALRDGGARDVDGPAPRADRRSSASIRGRCRIRCRSGSRSAARRSRRCAPARSACRWRSRSSAAQPERFAPVRRAAIATRRGEAGHDPATLPVSINSHGYVAETSQQAADEFFPAYAAMMNRDRPRARLAADHARSEFEPRRTPRGALVVGSPERGDREDPLPARAVRPPSASSRRSSVGALPHDAGACARSSCSAPRSRRSCDRGRSAARRDAA